MIYFVRHAKSIWDPNIPEQQRALSPEGKKQAAAIVSKLSARNIQKIYSSTAKRAIQTIEPFAKNAGLKIEIIPEFREREMTPCDSFETFISNVKRTWQDFNFKPKGWERGISCQKRAFEKLKKLAKIHEDKNIAISSHGMVISLCLNKIDLSWSFQEWKDLTMPAIVALSYKDGLFSIKKIIYFSR